MPIGTSALDAHVSIYDKVTQKYSQETAPIRSVLEDIQKGRWGDVVGSARAEYQANGKAGEYSSLKKALPAFTPAGKFPKRHKSGIVDPSGILPIDIDGLNQNCLSQAIIGLKADPHVLYLFTSPSGAGLKVAFLIPHTTDDAAFKEHFAALDHYLRKKHGLVADTACSDICHLCFVSHDPECYVNPDAAVFTDRRAPAKPEPAPTSTPHEGGVDMDDTALIAKARAAANGAKFSRLWDGDFSEYAKGDNDGESEGDLALCTHLAFWTSKDADRIDRLFRQSGLMRDKWNRDDYRERTISAAIAVTTETYKQAKPAGVQIEPVDDGRPRIIADPTDIKNTVDACIDALKNAHADVYQRDGMLVTVKRCPRPSVHGLRQDPDRMRIVVAGSRYIQELATEHARWQVPSMFKNGRQYYKPGSCPEAIIAHMEARPHLPFRVLSGIITAPTLRHDGSIITVRGFDDKTGLFYKPSADYPEIPTSPSFEDALVSFDALKDVFCDFPFAEEHHKSAAIAATLTPGVRHIVPLVPIFSINSNTAGSGKGLAVSVISLISTGEMPALADNADDDELRKSLLAVAMEGNPITVFDNVEGAFGSPALDKAITAGRVAGPILGRTEWVDIEMRTTFFVTGNNIRYRRDMVRRLIPITLTPREQNPEERTGFKHQSLIGWVKGKHPELLAHAITIIKAYIDAGRPKQDLIPMGSFEEWSDLVRSAIVWLGGDDPCAGRDALRANADDGLDDLRELIAAWHECYPNKEESTLKLLVDCCKKEYTESLKEKPASQKWLDLGTSLAVFDPSAKGRVLDISHRRLSHRMPVNNGFSRIVDGMRIGCETDKKTKTKTWWVEPAGQNAHEKRAEYDDAGLEYAKNYDDPDVPF